MKSVFQLSKIETSKKILIVSYMISVILTVIVIVGTFLSFDMGNVTQIALASYVEVSACNIWYYKKATRENIFKHLPEKYLDNIDLNNLI